MTKAEFTKYMDWAKEQTIDNLSTATDIVKALKEAEYRGYMKAIAERPQGEWKRHPIPENRAWDICTACGVGCRRRHYGFNEDGTEWAEEANYPFCPNCGAKMKGKGKK